MVFEPPTGGPEFAHEIVKVLPDGRYQSKGLLNTSKDPWVLTNADMRGRVISILPMLGRVMQAIPIWVACVLVYLLGGMAIPRYRFEVGMLALTAGLVVPLVLFRPLISATVITAMMVHHDLKVYLVSTGVLNSWAGTGRSVFMAAGHTAILQMHNTSGFVAIPLRAALIWWQWVIMALICGSPLWLSLIQARRTASVNALT
jgi:hypothetical protein